VTLPDSGLVILIISGLILPIATVSRLFTRPRVPLHSLSDSSRTAFTDLETCTELKGHWRVRVFYLLLLTCVVMSGEADALNAHNISPVLVGSVALLVAHRTNNRKVVGSRPTKVVCITVLTGNRIGVNCPLWPAATPSSEL